MQAKLDALNLAQAAQQRGGGGEVLAAVERMMARLGAMAVPESDAAMWRELQDAAGAAEARAQARHAELLASLGQLSAGNAAVQDAVRGLQSGNAQMLELQQLARDEVSGAPLMNLWPRFSYS